MQQRDAVSPWAHGATAESTAAVIAGSVRGPYRSTRPWCASRWRSSCRIPSRRVVIDAPAATAIVAAEMSRDETTRAHASGYLQALGMQVTSASADEVVVEWDVEARHHQPMGIVHGGVHAGAVETACSIGATLAANARDPKMVAVGLENHTTFVRAVRSGRLTCTARPVTRGSRTQVWNAEVRDAAGRIVATGSVRLLCVAADAPIG